MSENSAVLVRGMTVGEAEASVMAWWGQQPENVAFYVRESAFDGPEWPVRVTIQAWGREKDKAAVESLAAWLGSDRAVPEWHVWPGEYPDLDGLGAAY